MGRAALSAIACLLLAMPLRAETPSFVNEIVPLLTRQGCNNGACHGKGAGQNGFKLSLRGYAPEEDWKAVVREFQGRRIDRLVPEQSLLLRKATSEAPHAGGKVFERGSRGYATLLAWLNAGAPGPAKTEAKIVKLEMTPDEKTLKPGEAASLQTFATFDDGTRKDVTWLTRFEANDSSHLELKPSGTLKALRPGASAVRAGFQSEVAVFLAIVPSDRSIPAERFAERNNFIDDAIFDQLKKLRIEPSAPAEDAEFLRRVYLDAIGTLPTVAEASAFLADGSKDKRTKLINTLLERPEFTDYWTLQLADLFQNRKERDHDVRGQKGVRAFHAWLREQVARNRPWNELVSEVLTATGSTADNPAVGYYIVTVGEQRQGEKSEAVGGVAQAFLGTRIGCAQCHNHPLERYTQDDYYHFAAFFSRVKFERKDPKQGVTTLKVSHPDEKKNKDAVGVSQPRTGQFMKPQALDRKGLDVQPGEDPRKKLVEWMLDPKNEAFAGAFVNRVWKHFFEVGLVEPVDDLRATNPASVPVLFKKLSDDFTAGGYDLRKLVKTILESRAYQLSSATAGGNDADQRCYSHYYARRLPAEALLDAISQATGVPENFPGYPLGLRAIQLPDAGSNHYFLKLFGKSERVTACACERAGDVTLPQLLHLQNGEDGLKRMKDGQGRLARLLKAKDDVAIDELFLATMTREPTTAERETVTKMLAAGEPRDAVFADLLWALLNSKNFCFNH